MSFGPLFRTPVEKNFNGIRLSFMKHVGPFAGLWANILVALLYFHLEIGHRSHCLLLWEGCYKEKTTGLRKGTRLLKTEHLCMHEWLLEGRDQITYQYLHGKSKSTITLNENLKLLLAVTLICTWKELSVRNFFPLWLPERWFSWKDIYFFFRLQHALQLKSAHLLEIMWGSIFKPWIRGILPWIKIYPQERIICNSEMLALFVWWKPSKLGLIW